VTKLLPSLDDDTTWKISWHFGEVTVKTIVEVFDSYRPLALFLCTSCTFVILYRPSCSTRILYAQQTPALGWGRQRPQGSCEVPMGMGMKVIGHPQCWGWNDGQTVGRAEPPTVILQLLLSVLWSTFTLCCVLFRITDGWVKLCKDSWLWAQGGGEGRYQEVDQCVGWIWGQCRGARAVEGRMYTPCRPRIPVLMM